MKWLWVGASGAHRELARTTAQHPDVLYCDTPEQAAEILKTLVNDEVRILLESQTARAYPDASMALFKHMPAVRVSLVEHLRRTPTEVTEVAPRICAFEKTRDGMQILKCAMHEAAARAPAPVPDRQPETPRIEPIVFEYHAPCR